MKTSQKRWRARGFLVFIYLDDIVLLGESASMVKSSLKVLLEELDQSGMVINIPKSVLIPTQWLDHLSFTVDLK